MSFIRFHQKSEHINFIEVLDIFPSHLMECKRSKPIATPTEEYITNVSWFIFMIPVQKKILWLKIAKKLIFRYDIHQKS